MVSHEFSIHALHRQRRRRRRRRQQQQQQHYIRLTCWQTMYFTSSLKNCSCQSSSSFLESDWLRLVENIGFIRIRNRSWQTDTTSHVLSKWTVQISVHLRQLQTVIRHAEHVNSYRHYTCVNQSTEELQITTKYNHKNKIAVKTKKISNYG